MSNDIAEKRIAWVSRTNRVQAIVKEIYEERLAKNFEAADVELRGVYENHGAIDRELVLKMSIEGDKYGFITRENWIQFDNWLENRPYDGDVNWLLRVARGCADGSDDWATTQFCMLVVFIAKEWASKQEAWMDPRVPETERTAGFVYEDELMIYGFVLRRLYKFHPEFVTPEIEDYFKFMLNHNHKFVSKEDTIKKLFSPGFSDVATRMKLWDIVKPPIDFPALCHVHMATKAKNAAPKKTPSIRKRRTK